MIIPEAPATQVGRMTAEPARYRRTILATCCIPWTEGDVFDEDAFRQSIARLTAGGIEDLYIFGTAGEGHAVSNRDFELITRTFIVEAQAQGVPPMVGVMNSSIATVLERIEFGAALGCSVFQISLPNWGSMTERDVRGFFDTVCGRYPTLQFIHYNLARAGRILRAADYVRIAADHPNLVGTKYGGGDPELIAGLLLQAPMLRHFLTELGFYMGCSIGDCGLLASVSSSNVRLARQYYEVGVTGNLTRLAALHRELAWMMTELRRSVGPDIRIDGTYDKIVAKIAEPDFPLRLLPPWESPSEESYRRYHDFLVGNLPTWVGEASTPS